MAKDIDDNKVVNIKRGRGRPPKNGAEAAAKAEAMIAATGKPKAPSAQFERMDAAPQTDGAAPAPDMRTAPAFGANEPDVGVFLKHVQVVRAQLEIIAKAKAEVKAANKVLKDKRQAAKAEGIVLGELDRAMADADTEQVDLVARERRYALYMDWLGKPIDFQADLALDTRQTPEQEKAHWFKMGDQAGRLGKDRDSYPEGIAPEQKPNFISGWDHGQSFLMRTGSLTKDAFNQDGSLKEEAPKAPAEAPAVLILKEEHFRSGTSLEDANRSTIFDDDMLSQFDAAERVVVLYGAQKRLLKEPGYVDDGGSETPVTEPQAAQPDEDAAALA